MNTIKFPKVEQFRNIVFNVNKHASYEGKDEHGEIIYNPNPVLPKILFEGTVKLHGTNASVRYSPKDGIAIQTRNRVIKKGDGGSHFGFTSFILLGETKEFFKDLMIEIHDKLSLQEDDTLIVYGEWAGEGIQKGVGISSISKSFFIFGIKIAHNSEKEDNEWVDVREILNSTITWSYRHQNVFSIYDFPVYSMEIDFVNPKLATNELVELINKVEEQCPVALKLGVKGIGEGIVWTGKWNGRVYKFKVKGEKHSVSKVKTLAEVDPEVMGAVADFVNYSVTINRVNQAIQESNPELDIKKTGEFLKWIKDDIFTEEIDVLGASNLTPSEVQKEVSTRARQMLMEKIVLY